MNYKTNIKVGVLGGGQLGKMISHSAQELGFKTLIFSDVANSCAVLTSNQSSSHKYVDLFFLETAAAKVILPLYNSEGVAIDTDACQLSC